MTDRDDLVRRLHALAVDCDLTDGWEGAAPDVRAAAARIDADGKLIAEMREGFDAILALNSPERAWEAVQAKAIARAILARLDAEAQR